MTTPVVLFDLDETLIDRSAAVKTYAKNLWQSTNQDLTESKFVEQIVEIDEFGYRPRDAFFQEMTRRFGHVVSDNLIRDGFYQEVWETPTLVEGVIEVLGDLANQNIPLGVISNGSTKAQETKLKNSHLRPYFDAVLVSETFGAKKPDASIYLAAAQQLHADIPNSWYVGDHAVNDVWGSKQVGFQAAWVHLGRPWPGDSKPCYDIKGATFLETMRQLLETLR